MTKLNRPEHIDPATLDSLRYFESLLEQAQAKQLLGDADVERLRQECLTLLAQQSHRVHAGHSSSLRVEVAQEMMASVLFTVGLALKAFPHPDEAVEALRREPIAALHQAGRRRIDRLLGAARTVHTRLVGRLVDTPNVFYRATATEGINGFFKLYDPDFGAHEVHITADYPVFLPPSALAGIEFIHAYLACLYYENTVCRWFEASSLHHLLCGVVDGYEEQLLNLYEPTLRTALCCIAAGGDIDRLDLTEAGVENLCHRLNGLSEAELAALMQDAMTVLLQRFEPSPGLTQYLWASLPPVVSSLALAAREHTLERLLALPAFPEVRTSIAISYGVRMDDAPYRALVEEVRQCRHASDILAMIRAQVHSLADLDDLLLDAALPRIRLQGVLRRLQVSEIAALSHRHTPMATVNPVALHESERLLQQGLRLLISGWPQARKALFTAALDALRETP